MSTRKGNEAWLKRLASVHFRCTLTSASWLNQAENGLSALQGKSLAGASVAQLKGHIDGLIGYYNESAAPFIWIKTKVRQRKFKNRRNRHL